MRKRALAGLATAAVAALSFGGASLPAFASSHREAPRIAEDPLADNTDVYAFVSPDDNSTVTILANYVPLQAPAGGPNFYRFGDDVTYQIHVDTNGSGSENPGLLFNFNFKTQTNNPDTFLYNVGKMTVASSPSDAFHVYDNWNRPQVYTATLAAGGADAGCTNNTNLPTPPDYVGSRSNGNAGEYHTLANAAIKTITCGNSQIKVFAGQRAEQFYVDLGGVFDLLGLGLGVNGTAGLNVNTIAVQVPKALLTSQVPSGQSKHVAGVWATSSRSSQIVINPDGSRTSSGSQVQVSRLGMPLVNEVVIPLGKKDLFNATVLTPSSDGQFLSFVTDPELAKLLVALGIDKDAPTSNRNDLVAAFLTGIKGVNQPDNVKAAEELRLNYDINPTGTDPNAQNRLCVLAGENDGFPNGRRVGDDVTDIEIQAVDGILCDAAHYQALGFSQCRTTNVPASLGDGVNKPDVPFQSTFPYLADPHSGH